MAIKYSFYRLYKEGILASLFFFILFIFQTKTLNTGDAGELVTASYGLGIAHPSGYPVYLMISKLFTFLPIGNIPTKVALVSSVSSAFLVFFVSLFFKKEKIPFIVSVFFALLLLSSYSFFGESLVAKFYPLNTLLIFAVFWLAYDSLYEYKLQNQLVIAFLLGISLGLHHTTYLMFIPLLFLVALHFKSFLKNLLPSLFLFILGASSVLYLMVRSWKPLLLNMSPSGNIHSLIYTLLRKAYGSSSSPDVAASLVFVDFHRLFHAIKNSALLLNREFFTYSFLFFFAGLFWLWTGGRRRFVFVVLTFLSYSVLLAYLTFYSARPDINEWYICANQYYLPLFLVYAIIASLGFLVFIKLIPENLRIVKYAILVIPVIYFPQNLFLNFYDKNNVAYYKTIDSFFVKPIKSIAVYSGDNDVFQGWYEKNVEKFRDDICLLSAPTIKNRIWGIKNGCNPVIYKKSYPAIFKGPTINLAAIKGYVKKNRLYSSMPVESNSVMRKHFVSYFNVLDFLDVLKNIENKKEIEKWTTGRRLKFLEFIHYRACLTHSTDDLFTKALCAKYANYLTFLAYDIGNRYKGISSSEKAVINISFDNKTYTLNIRINKYNFPYLRRASEITKYNRLQDYYLYVGELK